MDRCAQFVLSNAGVSMRIKTYFGLLFAILLAFGFSLLSAGCGEKTDDDAIEYVNEDVAYLDGDSCVERYLLYEESGEYKRYIAGTYYGEELPGNDFGTLFETGTYTKDASKASQNVIFSPKKQYNFDTKQLENLGLKEQLPYNGTLTDSTLTITWEIWEDYYIRSVKLGEVPIVYKRR